MNVDDLTLGQLKNLQSCFTQRPRSTSLQIGRKYFFRTPSFHFVGRVSAITDSDIVLTEAAWIADSGRFNVALRTGDVAEFESYPAECIINRDHVCDASPWEFSLKGDAK